MINNIWLRPKGKLIKGNLGTLITSQEHINNVKTFPESESYLWIICSLFEKMMNPTSMAASQAVSSSGANIVSGASSNMASTGGPSDSSDSLLVEVQGENSAYYKAYVKDIFEGEILLRFEDDWQPESKFPFAR